MDIEQIQKPKRVLKESQLRALAEGRKRSIETKGKQRVITAAAKLKKRAERDAQFAEAQKFLNPTPEPSPEPSPEPPPEPTYDPPADPPSIEESSDEEAPPRPRRSSGRPRVVSFKESYYQLKTKLLEQQQKERQNEVDHLMMCGQAPLQRQAYSVAEKGLRARVNKQVYESAFHSLFPNG